MSAGACNSWLLKLHNKFNAPADIFSVQRDGKKFSIRSFLKRAETQKEIPKIPIPCNIADLYIYKNKMINRNPNAFKSTRLCKHPILQIITCRALYEHYKPETKINKYTYGVNYLYWESEYCKFNSSNKRLGYIASALNYTFLIRKHGYEAWTLEIKFTNIYKNNQLETIFKSDILYLSLFHIQQKCKIILPEIVKGYFDVQYIFK